MSRAVLGALLLAAALCAGCRRAAAPAPAAATEEKALIQVRERGPVKVTLRVEPKEPTFADRVRFTIEAAARKGVEVTLPSPGENLGEFAIKDYDAPPEVSSADSTEYRRSYILEVLTSGEYKIPPMTISFRDHRPPAEGGPEAPPEQTSKEKGDDATTPAASSPPDASDPLSVSSPPASTPQPPSASDPPAASRQPPAAAEAAYQIVTDEIVLQVKPLADPSSLKELAPIESPAEPPPLPPQYKWPLGIAAGLAGAGLVALLAVKLLRRKSLPPPPVPPHERAYRELEWLLGQALLDRGELKEFFFHLSRILREYIENRFGLRAAEHTTEEFLEELSRGTGASGQIPREHQRLLREFLERADLVKFARYAPTRDEIESSFEAAKHFIEQTRIEESRAPDRAAHPPAPGPGEAPAGGAPLAPSKAVRA
jgi:hypothetical protein